MGTCAYPGCTSPVWDDGSGHPSRWCTRKHRDAMSQSHSIQASPSSPLCKNCHTAPVHVEASGRVHDFCGRRCAAAFGPSAPAAHGPSYYSPGGEMCLLCGDDPKHEINGRMTDFCSVSCRDDVYESAPALLEIPDSYEEFEEIAQLFRDKWLHEVTPEKPRPRQVLKIYKVYSKRSHMKKFLAYKKAKGNARRRWHGTTRKCVLGDESSMTGFCGQSDCAVCGILQNSFRVSKAKPTRALVANGSFQRFGVGIYTSATSSKSYDYIKELGGSPYMAMILSEVVMGKACKVKYEDHNLTSAPSGYDSVVGEPKLTVNYDEAVVYTDEAIRPEYLVIFEPGTYASGICETTIRNTSYVIVALYLEFVLASEGARLFRSSGCVGCEHPQTRSGTCTSECTMRERHRRIRLEATLTFVGGSVLVNDSSTFNVNGHQCGRGTIPDLARLSVTPDGQNVPRRAHVWWQAS